MNRTPTNTAGTVIEAAGPETAALTPATDTAIPRGPRLFTYKSIVLPLIVKHLQRPLPLAILWGVNKASN